MRNKIARNKLVKLIRDFLSEKLSIKISQRLSRRQRILNGQIKSKQIKIRKTKKIYSIQSRYLFKSDLYLQERASVNQTVRFKRRKPQLQHRRRLRVKVAPLATIVSLLQDRSSFQVLLISKVSQIRTG